MLDRLIVGVVVVVVVVFFFVVGKHYKKRVGITPSAQHLAQKLYE